MSAQVWAQVGLTVLGGLFGSASERRRRNRRNNKINEYITTLENSIPGVSTYYDTLSDMLEQDTDVLVDRTLEDFTGSALNFSVQAGKTVEAGKGLISGVTNDLITQGKQGLIGESQRGLDDVLANYEKMGMELENTRMAEINRINDAIQQLEVQKHS
jgi:hypothetical protein